MQYNMHNYSYFVKPHVTLPKQCIAYLRYSADAWNYLPHSAHFIIQHMVYCKPGKDAQISKLCFRCFKQYIEVNDFVPDVQYKIKYEHDVAFFDELTMSKIRDPSSWCIQCQDTPLWEVLSATQCCRKYGTVCHECPEQHIEFEDDDLLEDCENCFDMHMFSSFSVWYRTV